MKNTSYVAVMAISFAVLLAFGTAPALAQMTSNPMMQHSDVIGQHKEKAVGGAATEFSGAAKAGDSQREAVRKEDTAAVKKAT